jgi:hypothetical protein
MSLIDKFRELLGIKARHIDNQMSGDAQTVTGILKDRADMHVNKVSEDLGRHLDARIAEHNAQFGQAEPLTFDALLPAPPATALLSPVKPPAGNAKPEQEKPPAPVEASPATLPPPALVVSEASPEIPEASAAAAAKTKKPRVQRSRY